MNAFGPPPGTVEMARASAAAVLSYPMRDDVLVRNAYSDFCEVDISAVASAPGSTAVLHDLPNFFENERSIVFRPSFWEYDAFNRRFGKEITTINLNEEAEFGYSADDINMALAVGSATVYLCNPNNPTSQLLARDELISVAEEHKDSDFVIDETYLLFRDDFSERTVSKTTEEISNIHVVMSLSKFFAVPGVRSGALISNPDTAHRFRAQQPPYMTASINDELVPWLLRQEDFIATSRQQNAEARLGLYSRVTKLFPDVLSAILPQTNFMFVKDNTETGKLGESLEHDGILIREGRHFGEQFERWIRFCIKKPEDNQQVVSAMDRYFAEHA